MVKVVSGIHLSDELLDVLESLLAPLLVQSFASGILGPRVARVRNFCDQLELLLLISHFVFPPSLLLVKQVLKDWVHRWL